MGAAQNENLPRPLLMECLRDLAAVYIHLQTQCRLCIVEHVAFRVIQYINLAYDTISWR